MSSSTLYMIVNLLTDLNQEVSRLLKCICVFFDFGFGFVFSPKP